MPESTTPDTPVPDTPTRGTSPAEAGALGAEATAAGDVVVSNPQGLHLRPATEFARHVQASGCRVRVCYGGTEGDGASVLELAMMAIRPGAQLRIVVAGDGCQQALADLVALVERDFQL